MSLFVVFEGGDGAGKSTQVRRLVERLTADGHDVVSTRQPGGTPVGAAVREIVLSAPGEHAIGDRTEFLLFAADKAQHVDEVIRPALARGAVVVCDRYTDSSLAYQGAGRGGFAMTDLESLLDWATGSLVPDLTVVLDVDPSAGVAHKDGRDRIEAQGSDFHQRVREHFLALAARDPKRYVVLEGRRPIDDLAAEIHAAVSARL